MVKKSLSRSIAKTGRFFLIVAFIVVFVNAIYNGGHLTASHIAPFTIAELTRFLIVFGFGVWFVFILLLGD
jgi:hypothetical protein